MESILQKYVAQEDDTKDKVLGAAFVSVNRNGMSSVAKWLGGMILIMEKWLTKLSSRYREQWCVGKDCPWISHGFQHRHVYTGGVTDEAHCHHLCDAIGGTG